MVEYNKEVMGEGAFKAFLIEKFGKDDVSPEEMDSVLGDFFEQNKEMLEKYPSKEMSEQLLKDREEEELKAFLSANNISRDEYNGSAQDVKDFIAKELADEKASDFVSYLESKGMTVDAYNNADKATKDEINKGMADQNQADLKDFLAKNNISMDEYNSSKGDIKNWVDREMKDEKRLQSFLKDNNMTMDEYKNADSKTKGWLAQEMESQKKDRAGKLGKPVDKDIAPDDRAEVVPDTREEITPTDGEKDVAPKDVGPKGKKEEEKMKTTDGHRKSGMKNTDEEEEAKGPFKEGDIIDYMYNEWMIAAANWCYKKVGKKLKEWGSSAYLAYLDGLSEGRKKKEEAKKEGKPHKTLDKYIETQEKARGINDKYTEIFSKNMDSIGETFGKIKEGKFEEINFGLSKDDHVKLIDSFNKAKDGKLGDEDRKSLSPQISSKLQFLEKMNDLKSGKVSEEDLKRLPPERREDFLKEVKASKNPLADFCESSQRKMQNMKDNFQIVSQIAANYTAAKMGDEMARNPDFNEGKDALKNYEIRYMKETMSTIFSRMDDIAERGNDPQVYLENLAKASEKAKKTTDRRINGNVVMEYGAKPMANSGLKTFEELIRNPEADERAKGRFNMAEALQEGYLFDENKAKIVETITSQAIGIKAKEEKKGERSQKVEEVKDNIEEKKGGKSTTPPVVSNDKTKDNVVAPTKVDVNEEMAKRKRANSKG